MRNRKVTAGKMKRRKKYQLQDMESHRKKEIWEGRREGRRKSKAE